MKLKNILICVTDINASKRFYKELFGLSVIHDDECNVILSEGLVLQEMSVWKAAIGCEVSQENNASELYFEENDMDLFVDKVNSYNPRIRIVTPYQELPWGQKLIRFYDLDGNLIEVRSSN